MTVSKHWCLWDPMRWLLKFPNDSWCQQSLSHTRKKERQTVLDGFAEGSFKVLVANQVLDEGVDVPEAKIGVVIGGQGSTRQAKQRLGRILRKSGTSQATLYEVVCENTKEVHRVPIPAEKRCLRANNPS